MKFGVCTNLDRAAEFLDAGFDYVELQAAAMGSADPWEPDFYQGLRCEATNIFFPGNLDLYGSDDYVEYAKRTIGRAQEVGVKLMVVGSGGVRKTRAQGFPQTIEEAETRFSEIVAHMSELTGMLLAPESLNRSETDCFNSSAKLAAAAQDHGFGLTIDAYHLLREWSADGGEGGLPTPSREFWQTEIPYLPHHVHLAQLEGRAAPQLNDPMMIGFFARLQELGYDGRVSLECNTMGDLQTALETLKVYAAF